MFRQIFETLGVRLAPEVAPTHLVSLPGRGARPSRAGSRPRRRRA